MKHPETMNYLVLHLDLGIGGAEKLMVNIALALWNASLPEGNVTILTTHHDIHHCFEETKPLGGYKYDLTSHFIKKVNL